MHHQLRLVALPLFPFPWASSLFYDINLQFIKILVTNIVHFICLLLGGERRAADVGTYCSLTICKRLRQYNVRCVYWRCLQK
jgi:hypothetical protein